MLVQGESVAGGSADDEAGAELRADAGDEHLEGLLRVLGPLLGLRPQVRDQARAGAPGAQVVGEQREEAMQPGAGDRPAPVGHLGQEAELGGHPFRLPSGGRGGGGREDG